MIVFKMSTIRTKANGTLDRRYGDRDPASTIPNLNGGKPADVRGLTRVVRRNLAAVIRERLDPEEVTEWLIACWLDGAMPPKPGRRKKAGASEEPPTFTPLSFAERSRALVQVDEGAARARLAELPASKRMELARMIRAVLGREEGADPHRHETAGALPAPSSVIDVPSSGTEQTFSASEPEPARDLHPATAVPDPADW